MGKNAKFCKNAIHNNMLKEKCDSITIEKQGRCDLKYMQMKKQ